MRIHFNSDVFAAVAVAKFPYIVDGEKRFEKLSVEAKLLILYKGNENGRCVVKTINLSSACFSLSFRTGVGWGGWGDGFRHPSITSQV